MNPVHHWLKGHLARSYSETPPPTTTTTYTQTIRTHCPESARVRRWKGEGSGPASEVGGGVSWALHPQPPRGVFASGLVPEPTTDILAHPPGDSPSPEPSLPGPLHSMSAEVFGPSPPFSSLSVNGGASYGNHLSHPPEMNEAAVW